MAPDPLLPPNSAALLSHTGVSVKWENKGGGCPVMFGGKSGSGAISDVYYIVDLSRDTVVSVIV